MRSCSFVTLHLARFDEVTSTSDVDTRCLVGDLMVWSVGADEGAAGAATGSQRAFVWVGFGLHADEASGRALINAGPDAVPCTIDPKRYGSLHHPGDAYASDMYSQI